MTAVVQGTYEQDELVRSEPDEFHLACLLVSPTATAYLGEALEAVAPADFYDHALGQIWGFARAIHERGERITRRSLMMEAEAAAVTGRGVVIPSGQVRIWMDRVVGEPVYPEKIPASIKAVTSTAKLRRLILVGERIKHRAVVAEDYSAAFTEALGMLQDLADVDVPEEVVAFSDLLDRFLAELNGERVTAEVVPTPWPDLDELIAGGLAAGRSYVFAGRPGAGKSNAGLNIAANAAEQGYVSLVISQEMTSMEVTGRVLASGARAEYGEVAKGAMSHATQWLVTQYGDKHRDMPLFVVDQPATIERVAVWARGVKKHRGTLDLLVLDYLQLIEASDGKSTRERQVAHISRSAKLLAKELGCAVVLLSQLNRGNVKSGRRPTLEDLRESGAIEQDADAVVLLHHERGMDDLPTGDVMLILAKNRFGRCQDIKLRWKGYQARIGD